jgi:hypothetical protein
MRQLFFLLLLHASVICFGQSEDIFNQQDKKHYTEQSTFFPGGPVPGFIHYLRCDEPGVMNEQFQLELRVLLLDTSAAKKRTILYIGRDTAIINSYFDIVSPLDWQEEDNTVTGSLEIVSWTASAMKVKMDLRVVDKKRSRHYVYKGTRTFEYMEEK